jgi:uncharacterized protein DUF4238
LADAKNQHYVPQFLLRSFADPESRVLHTFDKRSKRIFAANPRNVAAEGYFYEFDTDWGSLSLEPGLADLEARAAAILEGVIRAESLHLLSPDDRVLLAIFFAVQFTRTRQIRESMLSMSQQLSDWLRGMGIDPERVEGFKALDEEAAKLMAMKMTDESRLEFAPHFLLKTWILIRNATEDPFLLSDNPVALHNSRPANFYGNLGLTSPGIEIHIPLTPRLGFNLLCPSFEEEVRRGYAVLHQLKKVSVPEFTRHKDSFAFTESFIAAVDEGKPLDLKPENVLRENSLQVRSGERWLFSRKPDFQLAIEMLEKHPELARGPRMKRA